MPASCAQGRMDVLMEIEDTQLEGALGKEFIQRGICPELSLGYNVTMSKSPAGFLRATNKKVVELSIVRQGARDGCKIRAFSDGAAKSATGMTQRIFNDSSAVHVARSGGAGSSQPQHRILM